MNYEIFSGGQWYGPADLPTINVWISEGRISPDTLLRQTGSTASFAARTLTGLHFREEALRQTQFVDRGATEMRMAWLCVGLGFLAVIPCCTRFFGLAPLLGMYLSWRSRAAGARNASVALVANAIALVLSVVEWIVIGGLLNR